VPSALALEFVAVLAAPVLECEAVLVLEVQLMGFRHAACIAEASSNAAPLQFQACMKLVVHKRILLGS
jgi:hypothetical protein